MIHLWCQLTVDVCLEVFLYTLSNASCLNNFLQGNTWLLSYDSADCAHLHGHHGNFSNDNEFSFMILEGDKPSST